MEIDKNLYKEIKEYCDLNGLKTRDYIHRLLKKAFNEDKYGNRPFMTAPMDKKAEENFKEIVDSVGGTEKYQEIISDLIFDSEEEQKKYEKTTSPGFMVSFELPENLVQTNKEDKKSKKRNIVAK